MTAPTILGMPISTSAASINNQTVNATMPSGTLTIGNLVLLYVGYTGTMTTPTGWTLKSAANGIAVFYRYIDGTESWYPSGGTVALSTSSGFLINCYLAMQISGAVTSGDPFDDLQNFPTASGTTVTASGITTTGADRLLIFMDAAASSGQYVSSGASGYALINNFASQSLGAWKNQAVAGATGPVAVTWNAAKAHSTIFGAILPVGAGPPPPSSTGSFFALL